MEKMIICNITGIGEVKLSQLLITRDYDDVHMNLEFEVTKPAETIPGVRPVGLLVKAVRNELKDVVLMVRKSGVYEDTKYGIRPLALSNEMKVQIIEAVEEQALCMMAGLNKFQRKRISHCRR